MMVAFRPAMIVTPIAFALVLSGCVRLTPKPPKFLMTLPTTASVPTASGQQDRSASTMVIATPSVTQPIMTTRVPVQEADNRITYLTNGRWVETPDKIFRRLLVETVTARTGRLVVDDEQFVGASGPRLTGTLVYFGVDARDRTALVTYDAILVDISGTVLRKQRFETRTPVGEIKPEPVAAALTQAANQVAGDVADWLAR